MFVLGINISHHPSVCLLDDGEIVYYLEDDRLNRDKEKELAKLERKIAKKRNNLNDKKKVLTKVELAVDPKRQQTTNKNTVAGMGSMSNNRPKDIMRQLQYIIEQ
mgnify:CR=1 FL=1